MDTSVQRLLSDKFYDKRKAGALESVCTILFLFLQQSTFNVDIRLLSHAVPRLLPYPYVSRSKPSREDISKRTKRGSRQTRKHHSQLAA